jgi:hypothetical protein
MTPSELSCQIKNAIIQEQSTFTYMGEVVALPTKQRAGTFYQQLAYLNDVADKLAKKMLEIPLETYEYRLSTNTIWLSFDYGEVQAKNQTQATHLALEKLKADLQKANDLFMTNEATQGFEICMDFSDLVVVKKVLK